MFVFGDPVTGTVGDITYTPRPDELTPKKQGLIDAGWEWVPVAGTVPHYESLADLKYEGNGVLSLLAFPDHFGVRVRSAADVDNSTREEIERMISVSDQLKEMRKALATAGVTIPSDAAIEEKVQAGRDLKTARGW
tara:strand:- start:3129 stop:3536 length:408 start_codon:yes stop_codon:yes gene_type:complete